QILLPKLRGGEVEAIEFDQLFQRIDSSIFNRQKFDSRLESNSEESALLTSFESISIVSTPLSAIISAIQYDFVCRLCLHYTELNDAQLMQMSDYLHNHQSETNTFTNTTDLTNFRSWLESHNVINRIRTEFVQGHADDFNNVKGASIMLHKHGSLQDSFELPSQPGIPNPNEITFNSVTLKGWVWAWV
ncbi:unnamed protein product, partial [Rotaria socialis]